MSELETELHMLALVELLRPAKDRTEAIALMHTKVRPRIVDLYQSQEMLAEAKVERKASKRLSRRNAAGVSHA